MFLRIWNTNEYQLIRFLQFFFSYTITIVENWGNFSVVIELQFVIGKFLIRALFFFSVLFHVNISIVIEVIICVVRRWKKMFPMFCGIILASLWVMKYYTYYLFIDTREFYFYYEKG